MFKIFRKKPETPSDILLEQIKNILFPPIETHIDKEGNKYHIDYSVDTNLDSVLIDLGEGYNDEVSQNTLKKINNRISEIRKLLDFQQQLEDDAKYVLADDLKETENK
jgi:hypothetical protein